MFMSGYRKRGLGSRGRAVTTETATTAETGQNRQNRDGCLFVLYFAGQAKKGKVLSRTAKAVKNRQNRHEGYPPLNSSYLFPQPGNVLLKPLFLPQNK